jgi:hypothetical protein
LHVADVNSAGFSTGYFHGVNGWIEIQIASALNEGDGERLRGGD